MTRFALLVIDVQVGAFDGVRTLPLKDADRILHNLARLVQLAFRNKFPIFYIQDCGKSGGAFEPGIKHWEIHPKVYSPEVGKIIQKHSPDAFFETNLKIELEKLTVKKLIVCGLHGEGCFLASAQSALENGFQVTIVEDCHGTAKENPLEVIKEVHQILMQKGAHKTTVKKLSQELNP